MSIVGIEPADFDATNGDTSRVWAATRPSADAVTMPANVNTALRRCMMAPEGDRIREPQRRGGPRSPLFKQRSGPAFKMRMRGLACERAAPAARHERFATEAWSRMRATGATLPIVAAARAACSRPHSCAGEDRRTETHRDRIALASRRIRRSTGLFREF